MAATRTLRRDCFDRVEQKIAHNLLNLDRISPGRQGTGLAVDTCRDIVVLNAAAVLTVAGIAADIPGGILRATEALDSGAVTQLVTKLLA